MIENNEKDVVHQLGGYIRKIRKESGLTMEQLSKKSGVSVLSIGNIENGRTNPTINILWKLSQALNMTLSQLIGYSNSSNTVSKVTTTYFMSDLTKGWLVQPVFQEDNIEVFRVCLKAHSVNTAEHQPKDSVEVLTVMKGKVDIKVEGKTYHLEAYDTINFRSGTIHEYINETDDDALLSVVVKY
ncbi:helix-turn-helix domain-containing protein [Vagococcus bubulae]|uniref:HTH cro/C1-type domain-containing protein n=1 Tax=Vagococcus bubulae TaxID=1977868 RepID=A0A429ZPA5_9ENTE|nr:XRE family transcriptional regulator [Vagococcus bubulae]RST95550.1 hypothetical protein CBF36_02380 [Vagococcus bubulae]